MNLTLWWTKQNVRGTRPTLRWTNESDYDERSEMCDEQGRLYDEQMNPTLRWTKMCDKRADSTINKTTCTMNEAETMINQAVCSTNETRPTTINGAAKRWYMILHHFRTHCENKGLIYRLYSGDGHFARYSHVQYKTLPSRYHCKVRKDVVNLSLNTFLKIDWYTRGSSYRFQIAICLNVQRMRQLCWNYHKPGCMYDETGLLYE